MNVSQEPARRTDPAAFSTFGEFLKYLRRRARLTQEELGRAVGYSREQINRFERNQRVPEVITLASLFVPALHLRQEPELVARFLQLAAEARGETLPPKFEISHTLEHRITALSPSERDAHRAAAEWAELAQGDVIEAARQYGLAGDFKHAADTLTDQGSLLFNQGKAALAVGVIDELLNALRAHHLVSKYPDVLRTLLTTRGDLLINTTRASEAEANYQEAMQLAHGAVRAALVYRWSSALAQRGRAAEALSLVQETLRQLTPTHRLLRAQLKVVEGGAHMALSHFAEAEQANREALELAEQLAMAMPLLSASVRARANNTLGAINAIRGSRAQALAYWQATVATAQLAGMRALEYRAQGNIANVLYEEGDLENAARAAEAALAGLKSIGDTQAAAKFVHLSSNLAFLRGELAQSLALASEACELKAQMGDRLSYIASLNQATKVLVVLERLDEARANAERAQRELEQLGDERVQGYLAILRSEMEMLSGNLEQARAILERAYALPGARQDHKFLSDFTNHLAALYLARGELDQAERALAACPVELEWETRLECEMLANSVAWFHAQRGAALSGLKQVYAEAERKGFHLLARRAAFMQAHLEALSYTNLPRWLYGHVAEK